MVIFRINKMSRTGLDRTVEVRVINLVEGKSNITYR